MAEQACDRAETDRRFAYPSVMEAQIRRLKHSLDDWKEIVLHAKGIFIWEKNWHPTALIGATTILFTFLWLLDPSILTVISVLGLGLTICDYLVPSVANSLFKPEKWTQVKDNEFENICTNLVLYKTKLELAWGSYYRMKNTNRKLYFMLNMISLSVLAWIGCTFNNLFLGYVFVTFILLLPGMEHNGVINKWTAYVQSLFSEFVKQAKSKVGQEKKD